LVAKNQLRVHVDRQFPLSDVTSAHALVGEGRTTGKVVLLVADQP
jgi:NADPH:quinone reductase-like Zn-dependent oxidoreductase